MLKHLHVVFYIWFVLITVLIQACAPNKVAQDSCGFVQNVYGERVSWKDQVPIRLSIHESVPNQYLQAIQSAAQRWNQAAGKTLLHINTSKSSGVNTAGKDGNNVIYFYSDWESDKSSEQARTSVYWSGSKIYEADIKLNGKNFNFYVGASTAGNTGVNIEALILHELGHVLGLKHNDSGNSVMATYLANNTDRVQIGGMDLESLKCEY